MMAKCWQVEPKDRPTFSELIEDMKEVVEELLKGDMSKIPEPAPRQLSIKEIRSGTPQVRNVSPYKQCNSVLLGCRQ